MGNHTVHCMTDLETLAKHSRSVITAIGAVIFTEGSDLDARDENGYPTVPYFYAKVDPQSCIDIGMEMDASTVLWWMQQSDAARAEITDKNRVPIADALKRLSGWYAQHSCTELWGNGVDFDNAILETAYDFAAKAGHKVTRAWTFRHFDCFRTVKKLFPSILTGITRGEMHHALEDAIYQAKSAQKALRAIRMTNEILAREMA